MLFTYFKIVFDSLLVLTYQKSHEFTVLLYQHGLFSWFFYGFMKMLYSTIMQVNDEYMRTLETLSKKIKFIDADPMVKSSKALKDVQPEVERLRQKAVSKVWKTIVILLWLPLSMFSSM